MTDYRKYPEISKFLINYCPEDPHTTSFDEINMIGKFFNLININPEDRKKIRNNVVRFYDHLMDNEIIYGENGKYNGRTNQYWKYNTAMMSVTAAIDYFNCLIL